MRILTLLVVALLPATGGPVAVGAAGPLAQDGGSALDFEAVDLDGKVFHGRALKGRIVLLDFWAVWCAPCIDAFPKLTQLARDLEGEPFELVGIALYSGDHEKVKKFLEKYTADYVVVVGVDDLAERYGVIGYPTYLLIDPKGNIHKRYVGALQGLDERVKADVEELKQKYGMQ